VGGAGLGFGSGGGGSLGSGVSVAASLPACGSIEAANAVIGKPDPSKNAVATIPGIRRAQWGSEILMM